LAPDDRLAGAVLTQIIGEHGEPACNGFRSALRDAIPPP
jgi:hypothetical protein